MTDVSEALEQEALGWVIRLRHADAEDWAAFDAWLAGDGARADAYWRLAAADADVAEALARPLPVAKVIPLAAARPRRRLLPILLPIAASIAIVIGLWWTLAPGAGPQGGYVLETRPGDLREAALPDGTRVALNGGTRLELDRADPRKIRLARGEARFEVVHKPGDPFVVSAGDARLHDIGTVFDVTRDGAMVRVAVAEGAVLYEEKAASHRLGAGDSLVRDAAGAIRLARMDPADVASWRARRLVYDRAPFALVAADLARATGMPVALDPALAGRRFSGGLRLDTAPDATIARAAALMGVRARRGGDGWRLSER